MRRPEQNQPCNNSQTTNLSSGLVGQSPQYFQHPFNKRRGQYIDQPLHNQHQPEGQKYVAKCFTHS